MTGQVTPMEALPQEIWEEILQKLPINDLGPVASVDHQFYQFAHSDRVWAQYPGVPKELRCRIQGVIEGTVCIEQVFMDFIEHRFIDNRVSVLEVRFAATPGAMISICMGAQVHPAYGPEGIEPVSDRWQEMAEKRLRVNCPTEQLTIERYVVLGYETHGENVVLPNPSQRVVAHTTSEVFGKYHEAYNSLPERWFYIGIYQIENHSFRGAQQNGVADVIYQTAAHRLNELPVGRAPKPTALEENFVDAAISAIKGAAAAVSQLCAGVAAGVIAFQYFLSQ